jgi:hypothetical protein
LRFEQPELRSANEFFQASVDTDQLFAEVARCRSRRYFGPIGAG